MDLCISTIQPIGFLEGKNYYYLKEYVMMMRNYNIARDSVETGSKEMPFEINYMLLVFTMFAKVIVITQTLIQISIFFTPQSQRLCTLFNIDLNTVFAAKCVSKYYPIGVLAYLFCMSIFLCGYMIRVIERVFNTSFDDLYLCFYYTFITLATVGYGDYYTVTLGGRIIVVIVAIIGVLVTALLCIILTDMFGFSLGELKSFGVLKQSENYDSIKEMSRNLMKKFSTLIILTKRVAKQGLKIEELQEIDSNIKSLKFEINLIKVKIENLKHQYQYN